VDGPPNILRVGLERVPWPLDPATAKTRDERTLVRALYPTPLTVDPRTNNVAPGLCASWRTRDERTWTLRCRHAAMIAAVLRPAGMDATARGATLRIRFPFRWVRFPYVLTEAQKAVPGLPGPFRVVRARPGLIVARRGALTVEFRQVEPHRAAVLFRRGELDEAPVALGDIRAAQLDPLVGPALRVRRLLAVDAVRLDGVASRDVRTTYWHTADRGDYDALVPERNAPTAVSLVPGWAPQRIPLRAFRAAKRHVDDLPTVGVKLDGLPYGRDLLAASWRDLGLDVHAGAGGNAHLVRLAAAYPQDEAILGQLVQGAFLGETSQQHALRQADTRLYDDARVIPIAWAVDARLVSPRVRGWSENTLGEVDYVRCRVTSRRP
jgi:hypothetical protein